MFKYKFNKYKRFNKTSNNYIKNEDKTCSLELDQLSKQYVDNERDNLHLAILMSIAVCPKSNN